MGTESGSVLSNVIGTVVGGLILALLTWIASLFPTIWALIISILDSIWSALAFSVPIPLGALILLILAATASIFWVRRAKRSSPTPHVIVAKDELSAPAVAELSQLERGVVRVLAGADGAWLSIVQIAEGLRTSNLIVEQALENLLNKEFIRDSHNYVHGTTFRLTSKGRDYAISQGYVSGWAQSA